MQRLGPTDKKLTVFSQNIFSANEFGGVLDVYITQDLNVCVKPALARRECNKLLPF